MMKLNMLEQMKLYKKGRMVKVGLLSKFNMLMEKFKDFIFQVKQN